MKRAEIEQEVIDMVTMAFCIRAEKVLPETTLAELGLDSLDAVEAQIMFEDRWGAGVLHDYRPDETVKITEIAAEIERRLA